MTAALVLGAVCGLSLVAAWRVLRPPPVPLPAALARLDRRPGPALSDGGVGVGVLGLRVGGWLRGVAEAMGADFGGLRPDLRVVGRTLEQHVAAKALLATVGLVLPAAWTAAVELGGLRVSPAGVLAAAVLLAAGGFAVPDLLLRGEAAEQRRDFVTALGSYLDLVVISLAGGAGVESALRDAARVGHGWTFARLRGALDAAQLAGGSPWAGFARLGEDLRVPALEELAASVALAGSEGARVRDSLAAKAAALRARQLSDAEADAQAATERMAVPTVLLLAGFMVLIGYPAVDAVLTGL